MGTSRVIGQPFPGGRALVDAIDQAMAEPRPGQQMAAIHRAWRACCLTAIRVTHAIGWARFEGASLGTSS